MIAKFFTDKFVEEVESPGLDGEEGRAKIEKSDETGTTTPKWDYLVNGFRVPGSGS